MKFDDGKVLAKEQDGNVVLYFKENILLIRDTKYEDLNFDDFIGINESDITREEYNSIIAENININIGYGNNLVDGTGANDAFKITSKYWGTDVITNFNLETSRIDVSDLMYSSQTIDDLNIQNIDGDAVIKFGNEGYQKLVLRGINADDLVTANFQFSEYHVVGGDGDNIINGNGNIKTIDGGAGDDILTGDRSTTKIDGGDGDDIISSNGWLYDATLTGGSGRDTFIINEDFFDSVNNITDFNPAEDKIDLSILANSSSFDLSKLSDLKIVQNGADTVIDVDNSSKIILQNFDANNLRVENFIGVEIDIDTIVVSQIEKIGDASSIEDQTLQGDWYNNEIEGGSGNDTISGGNEGDDRIFGNAGNDVINSDRGNDFVSGGDGDDTINGGYTGNNTLFGDAGNDTINGGHDDDELHGGSGDDIMDGLLGDDIINGGEGNDVITGYGGDDTIDGGDGDDTINGGSGTNTLTGGAGKDVFAPTKYSNDTITDFDIDNDLIDLTKFAEDEYYPIQYFHELEITQEGNDVSITSSNNQINLLLKNINKDDIEGRHFKGIEAVSLITEDQIINGDFNNNNLAGGLGNDTINGGYGGSDTLTGNAGDDTFVIESKYSWNGSVITDTITDFTIGEDKIDLTKIWTVTDFDSLQISQSGSDTVIQVNDSHKIVLKKILTKIKYHRMILFSDIFQMPSLMVRIHGII